MRLQESVWRESWMSEKECLVMKRFMAAMLQLFKQRGVRESSLLILRTVDVGIHVLVSRRLEQALMPTCDENGEVRFIVGGALADQIGKARERLRKAIRELEDACARLGAPIDVGVADQMAPLVRRTRDVLNDEGVDLSES